MHPTFLLRRSFTPLFPDHSPLLFLLSRLRKRKAHSLLSTHLGRGPSTYDVQNISYFFDPLTPCPHKTHVTSLTTSPVRLLCWDSPFPPQSADVECGWSIGKIMSGSIIHQSLLLSLVFLVNNNYQLKLSTSLSLPTL